jgi:ribosomal protein L7Ae-like RNA K-turn-binding protein
MEVINLDAEKLIEQVKRINGFTTYKEVYTEIGVSKSTLYRYRKNPNKYGWVEKLLIENIRSKEKHVIVIAEGYNQLIGYHTIATCEKNVDVILQRFTTSRLEAVIYTGVHEKLTPSVIEKTAEKFDFLIIAYGEINNNRNELIDSLIYEAKLNKSWETRLRNKLFKDEPFFRL